MAVTVASACIAVLLVATVVVDVLACIGLLAMRTTLQRLHFVGPATCVAPVLTGIAVAAGTHATKDQAAKGIVIAMVLLLFAGVLSHETGRAALARGAENR